MSLFTTQEMKAMLERHRLQRERDEAILSLPDCTEEDKAEIKERCAIRLDEAIPIFGWELPQ